MLRWTRDRPPPDWLLILVGYAFVVGMVIATVRAVR